jgi:hypothetical protein
VIVELTVKKTPEETHVLGTLDDTAEEEVLADAVLTRIEKILTTNTEINRFDLTWRKVPDHLSTCIYLAEVQS